MPLLKGVASKSTPKEAINYITNPKKASIVSVRNLFEDEDYAKQFADTMKLYSKGKKYDERKYYHFKLSCARDDDVSDTRAHNYAEHICSSIFKDCECVIATHTDTKTVHSHIIVNAINPMTGKKLHITKDAYGKMKDKANEIGKIYGFTETDFRKKAKHNRTTEEKKIILKGGTSWKEELREVIEEAKQTSFSTEDFEKHLALYGVKITRSKTEYSYLHPHKQKPIRGDKLGENYVKKEIMNVIDKNRHRGTTKPDIRNGKTNGQIQNYDGQSASSRSISEIQREMQQLDTDTNFAHRGLDGQSERIKNKQQLQPAVSTGKNVGNNKRIEENNSGRKAIQNGNNQPIKKRDYSFSK